jgi:hypothetical protein
MPATNRLSKSQLSMYLRTTCDRELYLSLHPESELARHNMPVPLKARPGIGVLKRAGIEFEEARNAQLVTVFPALVLRKGHAGILDDDLLSLLGRVKNTPSLILQGKFQPQAFRTQILTNLSISPTLQTVIPPIQALIPDVVVVRRATAGEEEVMPDGTRRVIGSLDQRLALVVIDIKHASEANPSYSAEVALYTFMLSNLIQYASLQNRFLISANALLWTRSSAGQSQLEALLTVNSQASPDQKLAALLEDCDDVPFKFYMQTVRRFFTEDLLRVIRVGDNDWRHLDWHVNPKCSACDWLGYGRWLSKDDRARIATHPDHYCAPNAELLDHLSRIVGVSRGARKILGQHALTTTASVAKTSGNETPYRQHSLLKRERYRIPDRAAALQTGQVTTDSQALIPNLARSVNLQICVAINFDAGAGLLTGLAVMARLGFPYRATTPVTPLRLGQFSYVVDGKSAQQEWIALQAFLMQFEQFTSTAERQFISNGFTNRAGAPAPITAQVAFWEKRQFEALCAALGRHLPQVLALASRRARALAWLFPPEELIERDEGEISPTIIFVEDIIRRIVSIPSPHSFTLFDTAEHYHFGLKAPRIPDAYYREYLSNGVPRERIYELWSGADPILRGGIPFPRANLIARFLDAMRAQATSLDSVVLRLRTDFRGQLKGRPAPLQLSIPRGPQQISFDGKLWVWWDQLEFAKSYEAYARLSEPGFVLEAAHNAIRLTARIGTTPNNDPVYSVSAESAESKLDDGDGYLAIGLDSQPGFPLAPLAQHVLAGVPTYNGNPSALRQPLYASLQAQLITFDRRNLIATVRFSSWDPPLIPYLRASTKINLDRDIFLVPSKSSYDPSIISRKILGVIGNPPIATADANAARAMAQPSQHPGSDPVTPAAEILWSAPALQTGQVRTLRAAEPVVQIARTFQNLNPSQERAVRDALTNRLAVLWGPPGTGKTRTPVGLIHAVTREASDQDRGINILVSGPTYKAVEHVISRLIESLENDPSVSCDIYVGYSRSRDPVGLTTIHPNVKVRCFHIQPGDLSWTNCQASLLNQNRITIFATTVHQAHKLPDALHNSPCAPIIDIAILDESSQIPVSLSLSAMAALKPGAQLVVAGDHFQMPPIVALEPPLGAEYLVGSIQTYLANALVLVFMSLSYMKTIGQASSSWSSREQSAIRPNLLPCTLVRRSIVLLLLRDSRIRYRPACFGLVLGAMFWTRHSRQWYCYTKTTSHRRVTSLKQEW